MCPSENLKKIVFFVVDYIIPGWPP
jgi:hypothetical protein